MNSFHLKNIWSAHTFNSRPGRQVLAQTEELTMTYIFSLAVMVLGLGIWQERTGSAHTESELGSERHGQRC